MLDGAPLLWRDTWHQTEKIKNVFALNTSKALVNDWETRFSFPLWLFPHSLLQRFLSPTFYFLEQYSSFLPFSTTPDSWFKLEKNERYLKCTEDSMFTKGSYWVLWDILIIIVNCALLNKSNSAIILPVISEFVLWHILIFLGFCFLSQSRTDIKRWLKSKIMSRGEWLM